MYIFLESRKAEISEDQIMKDCCLDSEGLHPIDAQVMEAATCSVRECKAGSDHRGHSTPYWHTRHIFPECECCHLDGAMIPPGGWILSGIKQNLTCCEGNLLLETGQHQHNL